MEIKCPRYKSLGCTEDHDCMVEVEISTAELIAELKKRGPCDKCNRHPSCCIACRWCLPNIDNFKEIK